MFCNQEWCQETEGKEGGVQKVGKERETERKPREDRYPDRQNKARNKERGSKRTQRGRGKGPIKRELERLTSKERNEENALPSSDH